MEPNKREALVENVTRRYLSLETVLVGGVPARWAQPLTALLNAYLVADHQNILNRLRAVTRRQAESFLALAHGQEDVQIAAGVVNSVLRFILLEMLNNVRAKLPDLEPGQPAAIEPQITTLYRDLPGCAFIAAAPGALLPSLAQQEKPA